MPMQKSHWHFDDSLPLTLLPQNTLPHACRLSTISSSSNLDHGPRYDMCSTSSGRTCALSFSHSARAFAAVSFSAFSCACCEIWCFVCFKFSRQNTAKHHKPHPTQKKPIINLDFTFYPSRHTPTGIPLSCNSALCSSCLTVAAASSAAASRFDKRQSCCAMGKYQVQSIRLSIQSYVFVFLN